MAHFEGTSSNFDSSVAGQTNSFFMPEVYSKNVQLFFRKAAVADAITNTDYMGEIKSFGDTVKIIKEPVIAVNDYVRHGTTTRTKLTDQELILVVDQARHFQFEVDDIEKNMSHVNWLDVASKSAAYALKDDYDKNILTYISANVSATTPDHVIGADSATAGTLADIDGGASESVYLGYGSGKVDPLDLMSRMARMLDEQDVPEEDRWFLASPDFYEVLAESSSKLLSVDYNAGQGSIRNGLVSSGLLRGFKMYKSNNVPKGDNAGIVLAGHISAVASAGTLLSTEVLRSQGFFGEIVRGLHVFGRKVLRPESLVKAFWNTTTDE